MTADRAHVALAAGGLHYAVAALEGIRVYGGRPFRLRDHSERLLHSAEAVGLHVTWTAEELDQAVYTVVEANDMSDGYVRPLAWRGDVEMRLTATRAPAHVAVMARPLPSRLGAQAEIPGMSLATSRWRRPPAFCLPVTAKGSAGYLIGTLAHTEAVAAGFDDALLLDADGRVCESTGANVFAVLDGVLTTPLPGPALDGITRRTVLELAARDGVPTSERPVTTGELARAEEVFLTGTAVEVAPVSRIDDTHYTTGPITRQLVAHYRDHVAKETA